MTFTLDTAKLYRAVQGKEAVTYYSRTAEGPAPGAFAAGLSLPHAKRVGVVQEETNSVGLKVKRLPWHVWSDDLGATVPKVNDVLQDAAGARWSVERVTPNRFRTRFRLETVKEP